MHFLVLFKGALASPDLWMDWMNSNITEIQYCKLQERAFRQQLQWKVLGHNDLEAEFQTALVYGIQISHTS